MGRLAGVFVYLLWANLSLARVPIAQPLAPERVAAVDAAVQAEMQKEQVVGMAVGIIDPGKFSTLIYAVPVKK